MNQQKNPIVDVEKIQEFYEDYFEKSNITCGWSSLESATESYCAVSNCLQQKWTEFQSILDVGS